MPELEPPAVPPQHARTVAGPYRTRRLTASRTVELLHRSITDSELPPIEEASLTDLRREFEATA